MQGFRDQLKKLKKLLVSEEDYHKTFTFFFTNLGENQNFIETSTRIESPYMKNILKGIAQIFLKIKERSTSCWF